MCFCFLRSRGGSLSALVTSDDADEQLTCGLSILDGETSRETLVVHNAVLLLPDLILSASSQH